MSYGTDKPENCVPPGERTPKCWPPVSRRVPQRPLMERGKLWGRGNINKAVTRARRRSGVESFLSHPGPWLVPPDPRRAPR